MKIFSESSIVIYYVILQIIEMPACDYIDYLLSAVGDQLDDETSFPSKLGTV